MSKWNANREGYADNTARKMPRCKDCKNKRYINNRYGNESIYVQSPCFMCKWNPTGNKWAMENFRDTHN